jgi:hypothetical protein
MWAILGEVDPTPSARCPGVRVRKTSSNINNPFKYASERVGRRKAWKGFKEESRKRGGSTKLLVCGISSVEASITDRH